MRRMQNRCPKSEIYNMIPESKSYIHIGKRITCFEFPDRLVVKINVPVNTYMVAGLPIFLLGWGYISFGFLMAGFNLNFVCVSIIVFLLLLYAFLWGIAGREIVTITADKIMVKQDLFGLGFRQTYLLSQIRNLRSSVTNPAMFSLEYNLQEWGIAGGTLAFDYSGKLIRFGLQLEKKAADELVARIKQYISIPE